MFQTILQKMSNHFTVYGSMILLGILLSGVWGVFITKRKGMPSDEVILIETYLVCAAIIGAKILYLAVNVKNIDWGRFFDPEYFNIIMGGGFVYYGGFIGGVLALPLVKKIHKIPVMKYMEVLIPALPFAQGLGRIGCHTAGCCYGVPYEGIFHLIYNHGDSPLNGTALFPVQLLESICCFILAAVLVVYVLKHNKPTPNSIYIYLYGYGVIRFIIEFFRYDSAERGIYFGLSTSQWISLGLIAAATIAIIYNKRKRGQTELKPSLSE